MPIQNADFKAVILQVLADAEKTEVIIDKFYKAAEKRLKFDREDLKMTVLRGKNTVEPSWKRNLRNCLQGMKSRGEIVNSTFSRWRLPSPKKDSFLDPELAWLEIFQAAVKAKAQKERWKSPKEDKGYHVVSLTSSKIVVMRESTATTAELTKGDVERAITSLNAGGGIAGRRTLNHIVAKEAALVYLHPGLEWDESFELIKAISTGNDINRASNIALLEDIAEAKDDSPVYQSYARKIRSGQAVLRRNLLKLYHGKCCISGTGPENVLDAAHIEPHIMRGNNASTNALLLRADIHNLFDDGLILIEPAALIVRVHSKLKNTIYAVLDGRILVERSDGRRPDQEKLQEKWDREYWGM